MSSACLLPGRRRIAAISIGVLMALTLMGAVEVGFRLFYDDDVELHRDSHVEPDPDLIWHLIPGRSGRYTTNSLGFRDLEPLVGPDVRRILLLGDSVSWGHGIYRLDRIFPVLAEERLNALGRRVDIISTGVPGYSTFQELRLFELRGGELHPDAVVLQFCLNDVIERYHALREYGGDDAFLGIDTRVAVPGLTGWLVRNSRTFQVVSRDAARRNHKREAYEVRGMIANPSSPEIRDAWSRVLKEITEIHELARRRGIPLLILVAPWATQLDDPEGSRVPQDILVDFAAQNGITLIDLLPSFARAHAAGGYPLFLENDESHFTRRGHALAAEALTAALLELDL